MGTKGAALLVLVAVAFATGAASDEPRVTINPSSAKPGDRVSVSLQECSAAVTDTVVASSMAFEGRHLRLTRNAVAGWAGSVPVDDAAVSSAHEVVVRCADREVKAFLTVVRPSHPTSGPETGGGGLAMAGEEARVPWLAGAVSVLALATGAGAAAFRRRRVARE